VSHVLAAMPPYVDEVILVDGYSVDGTIEAALAVRPDLVVVRQSRRGKSNALAAGIAAARGDYVVMLDADGSMDPGELHSFVAALDAGAEYAKGTRHLSPGGSADLTALRRAGNALLSKLTNVLFKTQFTDLCYGYNAFRRTCRSVFQLPDPHVPWPVLVWGDGFEVETLMNIRAAKAGLVIHEVASFEQRRRYGQSNLRTFRDGMRVLRTIMRERRAGVGRAGQADRSERQPQPVASSQSLHA
jgi:glycosyltransferase involved in cell wall biosynthesis